MEYVRRSIFTIQNINLELSFLSIIVQLSKTFLKLINIDHRI